MKKNFLIIGHYSGSLKDFDSRNYQLSKQLIKHGYNVTIINAAYSHRLNEPKLINEKLHYTNINGVNFISVKTPVYKGNGFKRFFNMLVFTFRLLLNYKLIIKLSGIPSFIFTSYPHPFQMIPSLWLKFKYKSVLIMDLRDIWPDSILQLTKIKKYNPIIIIMRFIEALSIKHSDMIVSPLINISSYIEKRKPNINKKTYYLNQMFDGDLYKKDINVVKHNTIIKTNYYPFNVGYVGGITDSNVIDLLLGAAERIPNIGFHIIGDGNLYHEFYERYKETDNIFFYGAFNKEEAFKSMSFFDLLYRGEPDLGIYEYGVAPLKLYEYMFSGRPIIQSSNSKNNIVDLVGCGMTSCCGDIDGLVDNIVNLSRLSEVDLREIGNKGKNYVLNHCTSKQVVDNFIEYLKNSK